MEASASQFEVKPGVLHRIVDGEAVMLDLETGEYYGLNNVGTHIWGMLEAGSSLPSICESVRENFEINGSDVREDVEFFLESLRAKGLIKPNRTNGGAH
ncbi:MAG TPA: PqqD family protein [Dehalococcoidia bacterium]|jgi:hypothetical protein|nr:PqqD family protein [Dehalococcoidia bacterium]